ncbi:Uncharacterised protein [Chromobacterium vaccinii]|nr:Uncharacterised protein [Chromobacterium vaccinii]
MNHSITLPHNGREATGLPLFPYLLTQHAKETV